MKRHEILTGIGNDELFVVARDKNMAYRLTGYLEPIEGQTARWRLIQDATDHIAVVRSVDVIETVSQEQERLEAEAKAEAEKQAEAEREAARQEAYLEHCVAAVDPYDLRTLRWYLDAALEAAEFNPAAVEGKDADQISRYLVDRAEAEGERDLYVAALNAVESGGWPMAMGVVNDRLLRGADDNWSGRHNDVRRAYFDGVRSAARVVTQRAGTGIREMLMGVVEG